METSFPSEHPPCRPPTTPSVSLPNLELFRPPEKSEVRMGAGPHGGSCSAAQSTFSFPGYKFLKFMPPPLLSSSWGAAERKQARTKMQEQCRRLGSALPRTPTVQAGPLSARGRAPRSGQGLPSECRLSSLQTSRQRLRLPSWGPPVPRKRITNFCREPGSGAGPGVCVGRASGSLLRPASGTPCWSPRTES